MKRLSVLAALFVVLFGLALDGCDEELEIPSGNNDDDNDSDSDKSPPKIEKVVLNGEVLGDGDLFPIEPGAAITANTVTTEPDGGDLQYSYSFHGKVIGKEQSQEWEAPDREGTYILEVKVSNKSGSNTWRITIEVEAKGPLLIITEPEEGSSCEQQRVLAEGRNYNIEDNMHVWILVFPKQAGLFYPQSDNPESLPPIITRPDGEWSIVVYIGIEGVMEKAEEFYIHAALADDDASRSLSDTLEEWKAKGSWPGLVQLPKGVQLKDKITVKRIR